MGGINMSETPVTEPTQEKQLDFDPKQVEAELVRIAQERADDPIETAASTYRIYLPFYEKNLAKISTRGLRRVINFLVKYPLEQDDIKAANPFEREMMELINTLLQAKFVMVLGTYQQHAEELYNASISPLTQEESEQVISDLKAGGASDEDIASIHKTVDNTTIVGVE